MTSAGFSSSPMSWRRPLESTTPRWPLRTTFFSNDINKCMTAMSALRLGQRGSAAVVPLRHEDSGRSAFAVQGLLGVTLGLAAHLLGLVAQLTQRTLEGVVDGRVEI